MNSISLEKCSVVLIRHDLIMKRIFCLFYIIICFSISSCIDKGGSPSESPHIELEEKPNAPLPKSFDELVAQYESTHRGDWQKPQLVLDAIGDLSDKTVVDLGCGTGYFTFRILPLAKKVIALDIDDRMVQFVQDLQGQLDTPFKEKLEVRLVKRGDPGLAQNEADIIFMSNTYSLIKNRVAYIKKLKDALDPDGFVFIIDYKKKMIPIHPDQDSRVPLYQVEQELIEAGYEIGLADDLSLPYQYIVIARPIP